MFSNIKSFSVPISGQKTNPVLRYWGRDTVCKKWCLGNSIWDMLVPMYNTVQCKAVSRVVPEFYCELILSCQCIFELVIATFSGLWFQSKAFNQIFPINFPQKDIMSFVSIIFQLLFLQWWVWKGTDEIGQTQSFEKQQLLLF